MKKLLIILFFFNCFALYPQNIISVIHTPVDNGFGLRYDKKMGNEGLYIALSAGTYRIEENIGHSRISGGISGYITNDDNIRGIFSAGMVINDYQKPIPNIKPISFEFGAGGLINNFFAGFLLDPVNQEVTFCLGVSF